MGIGIQAVISDGDPAFTGDVIGHSNDDLQVIHPLDLLPRLGPHPAVDVEPCVLPGENPLGSFGAQEFLVDK